MLIVPFVLLGDDGFRRGGLIYEAVLPFFGVVFVPDLRVERCITEYAAIHVNNFPIRDIQAICNQRYLIGTQITTAVQRRYFAFDRV